MRRSYKRLDWATSPWHTFLTVFASLRQNSVLPNSVPSTMA